MDIRTRSNVTTDSGPGSTSGSSKLYEVAQAGSGKAVATTPSAKTGGKRKRGAEDPSTHQPAVDFPSSFPNSLTQSTPLPPLPKPQPGEIDKSSLIANCGSGFAVTTMSITTSASIETKVTTALKILSAYPTPASEKAPVVLFCAKGDAASKMISIAEISKRNIASAGGKWFEYTTVESKIQERKGPEPVSNGDRKPAMLDEDEEEGFEVMKTPFERIIADRPKVRSVPVMAIYLSRVRIDALRKMHGEQTNAEPAPRGT